MKHKNIALLLSIVEIFSVLSASSRTFAATEVEVQSPESQLIAQVISTQGTVTDEKTQNAELVQAGDTYLQATANESDEERSANFSNALVSMQISTPSQADVLIKQMKSSSSDAELMNVLKSLNGAQFSECSTGALMAEMIGVMSGITVVGFGLGYKIGNVQYNIPIPSSMMPMFEAGSGVVVLSAVLFLFRKHDCA